MKFDRSVLPFLTGDKFSNGLEVKMGGEVGPCSTRTELLLNLCDSKRVLHIGFADHLLLIAEKMQHGTWLHSLLSERASRCVGIDLNAEAVAYCRDKLHIPDVYHHDIVNDPILPAILDDEWDVVILGEVVEHLSEPVVFLSALQAKYAARIGKVVITVPNAWDLSNFLNARRSTEYINTDHRYWFTPYTLAKVACDAGLKAEEFYFANQDLPEWWIYKVLRNRYPMFRETLVGVFVLTP